MYFWNAFYQRMHDNLIKYFSRYSTVPLAENEIDLIREAFTPKRLRRRQYFLQAGEVCRYGAFIVNGAMRKYTVDDKGDEHILELLIENWWANDRESNIKEIPSVYFIDACEDTDILVTNKESIAQLVREIPALNQWISKLGENYQIAANKRLKAAINLSAEERYEELKRLYPEFLQRFPQHMVASYLGISKDTLSRIRNQATKK